jgi:hypothetical protein
MISGLGRFTSYRGYYQDLAFIPTDEKVTASTLLVQCQNAMGKVFEGYKGGDFVMGELTPLWLSDYGRASGIKIMSIGDDGKIVTEQDD